MLVLSRQLNEKIIIGAGTPYETIITVCDIRGDRVRLGIDAPRDIAVHRQEVQDAITRESAAGGVT